MAKKKATPRCTGLVKSGKKKGKLKKGYRWSGRGGCPVAAKAAN